MSLILALGVIACPSVASGKTRTATSTDQGDFFASASLLTDVKRPKKKAAITGGSDRPGELVEVEWEVSCSKNLRFEIRQGNFATTDASETRKVRLPIKNASTCSIYATAEWDILDELALEPRPTTVTIQSQVEQRKRRNK